MNALFLAPHSDDECLFGSFTLLQFLPHVAIVFMPRDRQEHEERWAESQGALEDFGLPPCEGLEWLGAYEGEGSCFLPKYLRNHLPPALKDYDPGARYFDHVFAPAVEVGGHEEHNYVGQTALDVFGRERVTGYATYRRGHGRTVTQHEVEPLDVSWWGAKLLAMTRYVSQIERESTRYWFVDSGLREYYQ